MPKMDKNKPPFKKEALAGYIAQCKTNIERLQKVMEDKQGQTSAKNIEVLQESIDGELQHIQEAKKYIADIGEYERKLKSGNNF